MKPIKILPPRVFQLALLIIIAIHFLVPVWYIYDSPIRFIGLIPIFLGGYLNLYTDWLIKKNRTSIKPFDKPTALIEKGPFSYSRNPIYLGMVEIVIGAAFISGSVTSFLVPIFLALILHVRYIKPEEHILENCFGGNYLSYKHRVRCWI